MKTNKSTLASRAIARTATAAAERSLRRTPGWPYCLQPGRPSHESSPFTDAELPFYVHLCRPNNRTSLSNEQRLNAAPPL